MLASYWWAAAANWLLKVGVTLSLVRGTKLTPNNQRNVEEGVEECPCRPRRLITTATADFHHLDDGLDIAAVSVVDKMRFRKKTNAEEPSQVFCAAPDPSPTSA
jgi:hypothetical protein